MCELKVFASRAEAASALADYISRTLRDAISARGRAACVLSGGNTPVATYRQLSQQALPWEKITLVPGDERLVAVDHEASNEAMIRRELMQAAASHADFLSLGGSGIPDQARLAQLNAQLGQLPTPLDAVLLGMGEDGHTASLFPAAPNLANALTSDKLCVVQQPPDSGVARLTLTPRLLLNSREIYLLFFGQRKRAVYERAMSGSAVEAMPVRCILQQSGTPVSVWWAE